MNKRGTTMGYKSPSRIEIGRIGIDIDEIKDELKAVMFTLDDYTFGVDVSQVTEVYTTKQVTAVPKSPEHIVGVVNLRGQILTVIDLKHRLAIGRTEYNCDESEDLNILIIEIGDKKLGMAVDTVSNVITIPLSKIETRIDLLRNIESSFLRGVGKISSLTTQTEEEEGEEEELIVLLNLNAILTEYEVDELTGMQRSLTERTVFEHEVEDVSLTEEELRRLELINVDEDIEKLAAVKKDKKKVEPEKRKTRKTRVKPEKVEPEKVKPEKVKPEKVKPEKVKPEKVKPEKVKPEKVEPEKTEPEKTEPEKTEPEKTSFVKRLFRR